jgi:hypothetical protein
MNLMGASFPEPEFHPIIISGVLILFRLPAFPLTGAGDLPHSEGL